MPEAGLVADEHLAGAEPMTVQASRRRVGIIPGRGLHQLAQHTLGAFDRARIHTAT